MYFSLIRKYLFLIFLLTIAGASSAQPSCSFRHYSNEDGLPPFSINDIVQDPKGFIWLATYDGLCKFDGYDFYNYKVQPGDSVVMKSSRIDKLHIDCYNRIWMELYGEEAICFDPKTERFWGVPQSILSPGKTFASSSVEIGKSGKVWLLSQSDGCICIEDSLFGCERFSVYNGKLPDNTVHAIHEDCDGNTWVLTNNGLVFLSDKKDVRPKVYFEGHADLQKPGKKFFSSAEFANEIWFGADQGKIVRYSKPRKEFSFIDLPVCSNITKVEELNQDQIIIETENDGFLTYEKSSGFIQQYSKKNLTGLNEDRCKIVYVKVPNQVWFVTSGIGIYQYHFDKQRLTYFKVPTDETSVPLILASPFVLKDPTNRLWVQPSGGGFSIYNEQKNTLEPFYNRPGSTDCHFSNVLHSAYFDPKGNLFFSSRSNGLDKVVFNSSPFSTYQIVNDHTLNNNCRALFQDNAGNIWASLRGKNRIAIYSPNHVLLGFLSPKGEVEKDAEWVSTSYCIFQDRRNNIWLGTRGDGLFKLTPKNNTLSFSVEHFTVDEADSFSLSNNNVFSIYEDTNGHMWVGTFGGGINLVESNASGTTIKFLNYRNTLRNYPITTNNKVRCIREDLRGNIYIGTTNGLLVAPSDFVSCADLKFQKYNREAKTSGSLTNNDVIDLCVMKDGDVFLATLGGGLIKVQSVDSVGRPVKFKAYTTNDGLASNLLQSVIKDSYEKIWICSQNELARFDPITEYVEVFSVAKRLLSYNTFSEAAKCVTSSGTVMLGYSNGILQFEPNDIQSNTYVPYLALTNFQLFNKNITIGGKSPLPHAIDDCTKLVLTHDQDYFTIEYAALDLENPASIRYAFMLEGLDKDWNYVQKKRSSSYTNLSKGEYIFRVKSTNSDGVWVDNERRLTIVVRPSFWETPLAYALYILAVALVIFLADYNLLMFYRLKTDIKAEKKVSEMKLKFFTDISHEIRTPLTLITSPVEYLIHDNRTSDVVKKQLLFISQNTHRILRLVNQILDLQKMQDNNLRVAEIEIAPFVRDIFNDFTELAKEQNIGFSFNNQVGNETVWVNAESLEKIVMNLLSNAFKYISTGKNIEVAILNDDKTISVKVCDDGAGIAKEKIKNLFVRFASFNNEPSRPSTGIGLSLVKELAEKHGAKVYAESEVGKGSCFVVQFQKGTSHFDEHVEFIKDTIVQERQFQQAQEIKQTKDNEIKAKQTTVLIVEDDAELRDFIVSILQEDYRLLQASDGQEGLELAMSENPDFIVSDIRMPRLDGIELLKRIRNAIEISHIPVILLTAKSDIETKLEGLSYGADDYITKPFSVPYFQQRIENLLAQRKRLQEIFGANELASEFKTSPCLIVQQDEEIMGKIIETVRQNIDKGDFTIDELASVVGLGRTTMYNKIKSLTGLAPVDFIRDIRITHAAQLVASSQLLIKEIAYMSGFSDTKYFGKCFKEKYGMTPLEFRKQKQ